MEFQFTTDYDQKALTAMARMLRKTVRRKQNRNIQILGLVLFLMVILLSLPGKGEPFHPDAALVISWIAIIVMLGTMLTQDRLNGHAAKKRLLPGTETAKTVFTEDGFQCETQAATTQWHYDNILALGETEAYFVFAYSTRHAQTYDKKGISGGTVDEFRKFISEKTGKTVQKI